MVSNPRLYLIEAQALQIDRATVSIRSTISR
jgi:hypothetical protein